MDIVKVLNNNTVITYDKFGKEIIVMGRGIAFGKKRGDALDENAINKVFNLKATESLHDVAGLIQSVPVDYFEVSNEIISLAIKDYYLKLHDNIYFTLADHIHLAIQRLEKGVLLNNVLLGDIIKHYPKEFAIGKEALDIIKNIFHADFPVDEAGYIALHFIVNQTDNNNKHIQQTFKVINEILDIVSKELKIQYDEDSIYYIRFTTHLKYFCQRMFSEERSSKIMVDNMADLLSGHYKREWVCINKIAKYLKKYYQYDMDKEEKLYLTIHIAKLGNDSEKQ